MALQQNRILRFLMVLAVVLLTIFIYASYYSNTNMTIPTRMHSAALISTLNEDNSILSKSGNDIDIMEKQITGRLKAISGNDTSNTSYADVLISPISNIQKFEPAKILKTPTTNNSATNSSQLFPLSSVKSNTTSMQPVLPSLSSPQHQSSAAIDPLKGIRTGTIYESGHLDVNPQLCPDEGDSIKLIILITSAPTHYEARLSIRQTWGHYGVRRDVAIAFILGRTTNQDVEDSLTSENYMYGDLIRGHFIDSYNNLTLKTVSVLEWIDKSCPQAKFVLKTDDDMFINVPRLLSFIDKHQSDKRAIYGRLAKKWKPIRNKKSKYYVSPGQFSATVFPQFTTGPAYLMTSDIVHELYMKSLEQTYLKLEDVYTTGIVAQLLGIKRIHVNEFLNRRIAFNPCNIRKAISVHMIKSNEQFDLWKKLLDLTTKCK